MSTLEAQRTIPFFNYSHFFESQEAELTVIFKEVGCRGAFILQKDNREFEKHLAEYTGAKYAIGVANGTDALIIALRAAGIGAGDEVIFCSHTYVATAASIHFAGATPIAADCGPDHMIDSDSVRQKITAKTKAIMPTQLNGRTADMDALQAIADEYNLIIIEDAAQGLGSKFKGKMAGTFGLAGTISFYPAKTLGCLGDGGAILTNDEEMYHKMNLLRDHGRDEKGEIVAWGLNSRLDNLQAAFLDAQLKRFPKVVKRRRQMADLYQRLLSDISSLTLPPAPDMDTRYFDAYQNYELEADNRDALRDFLKQNGIGTLIQWGGKAVHQIEQLGVRASLPVTEAVFKRCMMVPFNTSLSDEDITYVCGKIREFYDA